MPKSQDLLQGTLDMLILKAVSLGPLHGYGVLLRIQQISGERLQIQQGSLYPALYRLEHQGLISSEWGEPRPLRPGSAHLASGSSPMDAGRGAAICRRGRLPKRQASARPRHAPAAFGADTA